jgi:hypothetical protein
MGSRHRGRLALWRRPRLAGAFRETPGASTFQRPCRLLDLARCRREIAARTAYPRAKPNNRTRRSGLAPHSSSELSERLRGGHFAQRLGPMRQAEYLRGTTWTMPPKVFVPWIVPRLQCERGRLKGAPPFVLRSERPKGAFMQRPTCAGTDAQASRRRNRLRGREGQHQRVGQAHLCDPDRLQRLDQIRSHSPGLRMREWTGQQAPQRRQSTSSLVAPLKVRFPTLRGAYKGVTRTVH